MKYCAWCGKEFVAAANNQIYHDSTCRELATKEKISNYHRTKAKRRRKRICPGGCETILSSYNESGYCTNCMSSQKALKGLLRDIRKESRG